MENRFFEKPILNSPYEYPVRHWELDPQGQPTQKIIEKRRSAYERERRLLQNAA
jgi:type III restriction enzyme